VVGGEGNVATVHRCEKSGDANDGIQLLEDLDKWQVDLHSVYGSLLHQSCPRMVTVVRTRMCDDVVTACL
jgi:hypothetical protein